MTRKKWNRLRRRYPQLFGRLKSWEAMAHHEREMMKPVTVKAAIARMHSLFISDYAEFEDYPPHTFTWYAFNPMADRPAQVVPLQVPGLGGKLWNWTPANLGPEPGYPPQSWEKLEESLRKQSAALDKALANPANHPPVEVGQDCVLVEGKFHVEQPPAVPPQ